MARAPALIQAPDVGRAGGQTGSPWGLVTPCLVVLCEVIISRESLETLRSDWCSPSAGDGEKEEVEKEEDEDEEQGEVGCGQSV